MKNYFLYIAPLISVFAFGQEHFNGISTSSRVGILNANYNPAELVNMNNKFEVGGLSFSANIGNDKIGFSDIFSDTSIEEKLFLGDGVVNLRADVEAYLPSFAMKYQKWAFGISAKAQGKLDVVDVNTNLGNALSNSAIDAILGGSTTINSDTNQRLNGTTWGEISLVAARNIMDTEKYSFNVGATVKLLFPGSYANLGLDKFQGTITRDISQQLTLSNASANLNIAYSGSLGNSFANFDEYSKSVFGGLNGLGADIGANFQLKDDANSNKKNAYKINAGLSIRNIGAMTFKDENNQSTNYALSIPNATPGNPGLNLNQFQNLDSLEEIEQILLSSGYLTKQNDSNDFKAKLPTTINLYADFKVIPKLYVTGYLQQKVNKDGNNDQITAQNTFTITPRFSTNYFEVFAPIGSNEISGFNTGIGFRVGGFFIGSGSIVTALINDSKQADIYTGFRWSFL
ncbi:MAG: hypothetical protein ACI9XR_001582 [Flavobacterium sp.]|jgi:hypothetical protein